MKALGFNPVESTSLFKVLVSDVNLHPYNLVPVLAKFHGHKYQECFLQMLLLDGLCLGKAVQVDISLTPC